MTRQQLISFWQQKEHDMQKSIDFLLFDPERSKIYLQTIQYIQATINELGGSGMNSHNIITIDPIRMPEPGQTLPMRLNVTRTRINYFELELSIEAMRVFEIKKKYSKDIAIQMHVAEGTPAKYFTL